MPTEVYSFVFKRKADGGPSVLTSLYLKPLRKSDKNCEPSHPLYLELHICTEHLLVQGFQSLLLLNHEYLQVRDCRLRTC